MCSRIHFTPIIYKQFNFCRFRASAFANVDRLCAVFLYNKLFTVDRRVLCTLQLETERMQLQIEKLAREIETLNEKSNIRESGICVVL